MEGVAIWLEEEKKDLICRQIILILLSADAGPGHEAGTNPAHSPLSSQLILVFHTGSVLAFQITTRFYSKYNLVPPVFGCKLSWTYKDALPCQDSTHSSQSLRNRAFFTTVLLALVMGWFLCLRSPKTSDDGGIRDTKSPTSHSSHHSRKASTENLNEKPSSNRGSNAKIAAHTFRFRELATATNNFRPEYLLGEGGFGRVYKGRLESTGQIVAIKQLDRNGHQGNREFLVEVLMLSLLHHSNLVTLIGYCADGDQRLLVYEYMPFGSLEGHLFNISPDKKPLGWQTRMRIAAGAARGLEHLHDKANPPVIYRDFKSANILLDEGYNPKLSDFGLAKLGPVGDKTHVSTRVMGTYGYCAPEYAMTGQLTLKSDVYSFGVVLLELITGRKAIDNLRPHQEHNLVKWAHSLFKDRKMFPQMADPLLEGRYPARGLYQALAIAAMCIQDQASTRPLIGDVVTALTYLASQTYDCSIDSIPSGRHSWASSITEKKDAERDPSSTTDIQDKENQEEPGTKQGEILKTQTSDCEDREQDLAGDYKILA